MSDAALVAKLAESVLGPDPAAAPAAAQAAPDPAAAQAAQAAAPVKPVEQATATEAAVAAGSPKDEGDAMQADAIMYEIDGRKLTPQQIKSTFERYRDLNFENANRANLNRAAELAMKSGMAKDPDDVARILLNALKAQQSNTQMGAQATQETKAVTEEAVDAFAKWEEENAAALPPGYRDLHKNIESITGGQKQLMEMLQAVLKQSQGVAAQSTDNLTQARGERDNLIKAKIANNLEVMANKLGLDDSHSGDFMVFAGERGYTLDDFVDPRLAAAVMTDFKSNLDSPEMERLRSIAQRRQAFTGATAASVGGSAASAEAATQVDPQQARLEQLAKLRRV